MCIRARRKSQIQTARFIFELDESVVIDMCTKLTFPTKYNLNLKDLLNKDLLLALKIVTVFRKVKSYYRIELSTYDRCDVVNIWTILNDQGVLLEFLSCCQAIVFYFF
jgi:hypothetical protein